MFDRNSFLPYALPAAVLVAGAILLFQGESKKPGQERPKPGEPGMQMPEFKPSPEHLKLKKLVGSWDTTMSVMGQPETKGSATFTMFGDYWCMQDFRGDVMGKPYRGHGMDGYDPLKRLFVTIWVDDMSPMASTMTGTFDSSGKVLTSTGECTDPSTGKLVKNKFTWETKDDNTMEFRMYQVGAEGTEQEHLHITYKRRK